MRRQLSQLHFALRYKAKSGLILGYDASNGLEFIEVIPPSSAEFAGIRFFTLEAVLEKMRERGLSSELRNAMFRFPRGIVLYTLQGRIESVSVFRAGYYDKAPK